MDASILSNYWSKQKRNQSYHFEFTNVFPIEFDKINIFLYQVEQAFEKIGTFINQILYYGGFNLIKLLKVKKIENNLEQYATKYRFYMF